MPKFVPRQRKHKVIARQQQQKNDTENNDTLSFNKGTNPSDSNTSIILPSDSAAREIRRAHLRAELQQQNEVAGRTVTGKKKKRLDKYIETKLKKEANSELLKKLEKQKLSDADTRLLRSSKNLGRATESKREVLGRAERERRAGIDVEKNERLLFETINLPSEDDWREKEEANSEDEAEKVVTKEKLNDIPKNGRTETIEKAAAPFGSGLKRPLDLDDGGKPIIKKRQRTKGKSLALKPTRTPPHAVEEIPWEGFSSDDEGEQEKDGWDEVSESASHSEISESDADSLDSAEGDDDDELDSIDGSDEASESGEAIAENKLAKDARTSAFKAWATQQRNAAVGFVPSSIPTEDPNIRQAPGMSKPIEFTPRPFESDPLPQELQLPTSERADPNRKAFSVAVMRTDSIQEARLALPVVAEEQKIMEAVHNHDVIVVWGATGSGKTTQVPQFLFESGYGAKDGPTPGMIGVTQPRRVAAVSMANRVSDELGDKGKQVGYQIRFDTTVSDDTAIKFMTDGVLLREIAQDFSLTKYSAIVIDEAHERSVNTDILIGLMSRIVDLRADMAKEDTKTKPLKLIIMSATLRISDFTENKRLFRREVPPLLKAEGRQFPVTMHFARRTQRDYLEDTFRKICRGHKKLPHGGMLVFLTGQNEITALAKRLKQTFISTDSTDVDQPRVRISAAEIPMETEDIELEAGASQKDFLDEDGSDDEDDLKIYGADDDEEEEEFNIGEEAPSDTVAKVHVLPLYSQLPTNQQLRVFQPPPDGSRLIVLATNVAETSLTIPGVRYVFDCGRAKEKKYDRVTGVQSFEIGWISKASASQRAGRAGRTGPGHCYRLYSSALYERDFEEHAIPEILATPIEGIVLQLKSMDLQHVVNFPFPTPPDRPGLAKAEKLLSYLGALSSDGKITRLGRELAFYPLNPRFARMIVMGQAHNLTAQTIALVAALSVPEIFTAENQLNLPSASTDLNDEEGERHIRTEADNVADDERARIQKAYRRAHATFSRWDSTADCVKLLTALCAYAYSAYPSSKTFRIDSSAAEEFCSSNFLRSKALNESSQLRMQLTSIIRSHRPNSIPEKFTPHLPQPSSKELAILKQICAAGFIDNVAIRADLAPSTPVDLYPPGTRKPKRAIEVPYLPLFPTQDQASPFVYIHPTSVLSQSAVKSLPAYVVYSHLQRPSASLTLSSAPKTRMHPLTPLTTSQLVTLARGTPLVRYSKPVVGSKIVEVPRDKTGLVKREVTVGVSLVPGGGDEGSAGIGWSLGVRRVLQRKEGNVWVVEKEVPGA